jgi:CheY-like chemotaxis protein
MNIPADILPFRADRVQISQVLQNLTLNAVQAMPGGGTLTIAASNFTKAPGGNDSLHLEPGKYIKVEISDTGTGIPAEHIDRIFEPYFTTRKNGRGIGLATVHSIVKRHAGLITVSSHVGRGSVFTLYLPADDYLRKNTDEIKIPPVCVSSACRILVMDDDAIVLHVLEAILKHLGHAVTVTKKGEEALEEFKKSKEGTSPFALIISDLTVAGGMGGIELAEKIREIDAAIPIIVSTGYSSDPVFTDYKKFGFNAAMRKPYSIEEVKVAVEAAMTVSAG